MTPEKYLEFEQTSLIDCICTVWLWFVMITFGTLTIAALLMVLMYYWPITLALVVVFGAVAFTIYSVIRLW